MIVNFKIVFKLICHDDASSTKEDRVIRELSMIDVFYLWSQPESREEILLLAGD